MLDVLLYVGGERTVFVASSWGGKLGGNKNFGMVDWIFCGTLYDFLKGREKFGVGW